MDTLLELKNIEVTFSDYILVLKGLSLQVEGGRIVALLGTNGAGKTTTLKAMSGLLPLEEGKVTKGAIMFKGEDITNERAEKIVAKGLGHVLEGRHIFQTLTVEENLMAGNHTVKGVSKKSVEKAYEYFPILKERRRQTAGYLSGGEQQMLAIGRALLARPSVLLLDEPSLGLAPLVCANIFEQLKIINQEEKVTILLVEQNANLALKLADYIYVMENGRIVLEGDKTEVTRHSNIQEFYLGQSALGSKKSYREVKHYHRRKRWSSL